MRKIRRKNKDTKIEVVDGIRIISKHRNPKRICIAAFEVDNTAKPLRILPENNLPPGDFDRVHAIFNSETIPGKLRCREPGEPDRTGYAAAQLTDHDIPNATFGVYNTNTKTLVGGLSLVRMKILSRESVDRKTGFKTLNVSALLLPAFRNPGTTPWVNRVFNILEYMLDNPVPTNRDNLLIQVKRWEHPEGANAAFRDIPNAHQGLFDDNFMRRKGLGVTDSGETLPDGRKIELIRRHVPLKERRPASRRGNI